MQEALEHLLDSTNVLNCKKSPEEAIHGGEIKLSASILERGWNIASLSTATRGWDFRNATFTCNSETIPVHGEQFISLVDRTPTHSMMVGSHITRWVLWDLNRGP
jgi:hypothetical protein